MAAIEILFWISALIIVYAYFGYPLVLYAVSIFFKKPVAKQPFEPKVSVIMSAFNEEKNIEKKLDNLLKLDYPEDKLEILVGSDGALDMTDQIISRVTSKRVRFFKFVRNQGKPAILNSLVHEAGGTILVFTDVRQEFDPEAVKELVANFSDSEVGCVSGELYFKHPGERGMVNGKWVDENGPRSPEFNSHVPSPLPRAPSVARGIGAYWSYEKFLRRKESEIGSMMGATGAIYAIRRKLYRDVPSNMLVDDMYIPLSIIEQGYRAVFDAQAKAYDDPSQQAAQELKRKIRTLAGNYQIFFGFKRLFDFRQSPVAWQFFSHKLLRVLVPYFLILIFLANLFLLSNSFYRILFLGQILFYATAIREILKPNKDRKGIGYLPYTFCLLNYAAFMSLFRYLKGAKDASWEKAYE